MDGEPVNAKLHARGNLGQCGVRTLAAGQAIGDQTDLMAALRLTVGEIENVPDDSADRGAHGMQDTERLV